MISTRTKGPRRGLHGWLTPVLSALLACALPLAAGAQTAPLVCPGGLVTAEAPARALQERICTASANALTFMAACNVTLTAPVTIAVTESVPEGCAGVYHCGEGLIEVVTPERLPEVSTEASPFKTLPTDIYWDSVLLHELVHAAYDQLECPFGTCLASSEYLAYGLQVMSLPEELRAPFEPEEDMERRVSRDELNPMILLMAPEIFARKAWQHLSQREDPCAYAGQIMDHEVLLDYERP